jgi:acetyl-CoA carboxylase biotin carboxyl carrier protein
VNEPLLPVRVQAGVDGRLAVLAPRVGLWSHHPHPGALLGPGSRVGYLDHLTRRFALVLPDNAAGRLAGDVSKDRIVAVEFGQTLFELVPLRADDSAGLEAEERAAGHRKDGLAAGHHAVVAPTDGVFYRRPAPGTRAFVEPGDGIAFGAPLGLIEVMKTFNQIVYGGPGLPERARVVEVRVGDAVEVRAGQVLIVVR